MVSFDAPLRTLPQKWPKEVADILKAQLKNLDQGLANSNTLLSKVQGGGDNAPNEKRLDTEIATLKSLLEKKAYEYNEAKRLVKPKAKPKAKPKPAASPAGSGTAASSAASGTKIE